MIAKIAQSHARHGRGFGDARRALKSRKQAIAIAMSESGQARNKGKRGSSKRGGRKTGGRRKKS